MLIHSKLCELLTPHNRQPFDFLCLTPTSLFAFCFGYFIACQFFISSSFIYDVTFYLLVIGSLTYQFVTCDNKALLKSKNAILLLFAPFLFIALHSAVLTPNQFELFDTVRHTLANSAFILACVIFFRRDDTSLHAWFVLWMSIALFTGIYSISDYWLSHAWPERLEPIGQNDHPILGSNVYAAITIGGYLFLISRPRISLVKKFLAILTILCTFLLIILTHSRGPMAAFIICLAAGMLISKQWKMIAFLAAIAAIISADMAIYFYNKDHILPLNSLYDAAALMYDRPSYRAEIWMAAIQMIEQRPVTGYGLHAPFHVAPGGVNPHNLFLSTAYYLGIPGLIILLTTLAGAFYYCWKNRSLTIAKVAFILLIHAILACMTDQGEYVKSPSPLWSIFWLPIAMAYSLAMRESPQKRSVGQA